VMRTSSHATTCAPVRTARIPGARNAPTRILKWHCLRTGPTSLRSSPGVSQHAIHLRNVSVLRLLTLDDVNGTFARRIPGL
jgi:hypothetical protein